LTDVELEKRAEEKEKDDEERMEYVEVKHSHVQ
jgi:hypothetical protein